MIQKGTCDFMKVVAHINEIIKIIYVLCLTHNNNKETKPFQALYSFVDTQRNTEWVIAMIFIERWMGIHISLLNHEIDKSGWMHYHKLPPTKSA